MNAALPMMTRPTRGRGARRVVVVGAGPGGLATAMLARAAGAEVTVIERADRVGGRTASFSQDGYTFDYGPTFYLYPEILDPAGVSEQEFRRVIEKLNGELVPIFNPYSVRNMVDGVLGLVTGWLWEDFGLTGAKSRLAKLENWLEQWNLEMDKKFVSEDGFIPPKIIPLRRTGYMSVRVAFPHSSRKRPSD